MTMPAGVETSHVPSWMASKMQWMVCALYPCQCQTALRVLEPSFMLLNVSRGDENARALITPSSIHCHPREVEKGTEEKRRGKRSVRAVTEEM